MMTQTPTHCGSTSQVQTNTSVGNHDLCAWQPVRGITWVQTRNPNHARRMAQRSDSHVVVTGLWGGYLKTFEFRKPLSWAVRLIERYEANDKAANAARKLAICPRTSRKPAGGMRVALKPGGD